MQVQQQKGRLEGKKIIIGVTGSIAAYKAATLVSMLVKAKADVHVMMTENATKFIAPLVFETLTSHECHTDTFKLSADYKVTHVTLVKDADIFVIAPATANVIAKICHGICDDMLTSSFIACHCKKMISPAMNTFMYENPITQDNIQLCKKYGMKIIEPSSGRLACGDVGKGKMPDPEYLFEEIKYEIGYEKNLSNLNILVTAGPTQESLDPVRYITNHSTGKMGYAIASVAAMRGGKVTLVSGPVSLSPPPYVKMVYVKTAKEMFEAVKSEYDKCDIVIKAAAVADYRPKVCETEKIKKKEGEMVIELEKTDDILKYLGENKKEKQKLIGFSMETSNMIENSKAKLEKKNLDMIVANNLKEPGAGFGTDTNKVTIITKNEIKSLPLMSKEDVADKIFDEILGLK